MTANDTGLVVDDLVVEYQRRRRPPVRAVAGASIEVGRGQIVGLVGESGCGKSTLARAAVGLVPATRGEVRFEGQLVSPVSRRARPRHLRRLQMVFQDAYASLNPRRRIGEQIEDALALATTLEPARRDSRVVELLEQVGLSGDQARLYPHEFSGGQRQRICIARALAAEPSVIIADEPISALDTSAQAQIANLVDGLRRELNVGFLFISHDLAIVRHVADVVAVMYLGEIVEFAPPDLLWESPFHPYSEALIRSVPLPDGAGTLPVALPGEVPDPAQPPTGCRFHPRCPYAFERCSDEAPALVEINGAREVACWLRGPSAPAH